jgi:hypothetical protein
VDPRWQHTAGMYIENYPCDLCTHIVVESMWTNGSLWNFTSLDASKSNIFCKSTSADNLIDELMTWIYKIWNILAAGNLVERISKIRAEFALKDSEIRFLLYINVYRGTPKTYIKTVVESESLHEIVANQILQLIG